MLYFMLFGLCYFLFKFYNNLIIKGCNMQFSGIDKIVRDMELCAEEDYYWFRQHEYRIYMDLSSGHVDYEVSFPNGFFRSGRCVGMFYVCSSEGELLDAEEILYQCQSAYEAYLSGYFDRYGERL